MKTASKAYGLAAFAFLLALAAAIAKDDDSKDTPRQDASPEIPARIDVEYVLRNHIRLEQRLAGLLSEAEGFAEEISQKQAAIGAKRDTLDSYDVDTPAHQRISMEIAEAERELQATAEAKRQLFRRRESRMYIETYKEIKYAVAAFSREHGIVFVLAYNSESVDHDNPDEIERAIRNPVVYQENRNISELILAAINADLTDKERAARRSSILQRPMEELRATGLKFPFHRTLEPKPAPRWHY